MKFTRADYDALRRTIWGESRGEPFLGQVAVAWVVRNRSERRDQSVERVCKAPWQFSVWNENDPNRPRMLAVDERDPWFVRASGVAALVLTGDLDDPTGGADHYHTVLEPRGVRAWPPSWAKHMKPVALIGAHIFYDSRERV